MKSIKFDGNGSVGSGRTDYNLRSAIDQKKNMRFWWLKPRERKAFLDRETIELEVEQMTVRHKQGAAFWGNAAGYAPAFGVAGTVIGLIDMLNNLSDPSALGPALAVAFSTTLWGVFLANYIYTPVSMKLKRASAIEVAYRELLVEGILSIQAGANPRSIAGKLAAYLPPGERPDEEQKSA